MQKPESITAEKFLAEADVKKTIEASKYCQPTCSGKQIVEKAYTLLIIGYSRFTKI